MSEFYNQNYSKTQIAAILTKIKDCIREGRFIISKNESRQENIDFINNYNLNSKRQKEILLRIEPEDFCHSLQNINIGFEHEVLFVFCPQIRLYNFDSIEELVEIYTKFNLIEISSGDRVIVISFHQRNKSIDYLFR